MVAYHVNYLVAPEIVEMLSPFFVLYAEYYSYINLGLSFLFIFLLVRNFMKFTQIVRYYNEISIAISLSSSLFIYYFIKNLFPMLEITILFISFIFTTYFIDFMFSTLIFLIVFIFFITRGIIYTDVAILVSYFNVFFSLLYNKSLSRYVNILFVVPHNINEKLKHLVKYILKGLLAIIFPLLIWSMNPENMKFLYFIFFMYAFYMLIIPSDKVIMHFLFRIFIQRDVEEQRKVIINKIRLLKRFERELETSPHVNEDLLNKVRRDIKRYEKMLSEISS